MLTRTHQRGDTIVEVLIAMAITSLVLGMAYSTSSRALQVGRQAQERTEALKLAEGQIEQLKYMANDASNGVFDTTNAQFCILNNQKYPIVNYNQFPYRTECYRSSLYNVGIQYSATNDDTFTVRTIWDRLGGGGQDEVVIKYRMHP